MRFNKFSILFAFVVFGSFMSRTCDGQKPSSIRVIVVDVSSSMRDDGVFEKVRSELVFSLTAQPPSQEHPVEIITFSHTASDPYVFSRLDHAIGYIKSLNAGFGSTSIASGLQKAADRLKSFTNVQNATVLLYTDDLDDDRHSVVKAEEQLDAIFKNRYEKGLYQSLLLRNWSNSSSAEISKIEKAFEDNPFVVVVNGDKPAAISWLVADPSLQLVSADYDNEDSSKLLVAGEVLLEVHGPIAANAILPGYRLVCADPRVHLSPVTVNPNRKEQQPFTLTLSEGDLLLESIDIQFTIEPIHDDKVKPTVVPDLSEADLTLSIPIPVPAAKIETTEAAPPQDSETTVSVSFHKLLSQPLWHALPNSAAFRVELEINVDGPLPPNSQIGVVAPPGVSYLKITPEVLQPGKQYVRFDIVSRLEPAPETSHFRFDVEPPESNEFITVNPIAPLEFEISGPQSVSIFAIQNGQRTPTLRTWALSGATRGQLPVFLGVDGPVTKNFTNELFVQCQRKDGVLVSDIPVLKTYQYALVLPQSSSSYLEDERISLQMSLAPSLPTSAVQSTTINAEVVRQALFKLHLLMGCCLAALVIGPLLLIRLYCSLSPKPLEIDNENSFAGTGLSL